jgi:hypothetical protein
MGKFTDQLSTTKSIWSFLISKPMATNLENPRRGHPSRQPLRLFKLCHICFIIPRFSPHLFGTFLFDIRAKEIDIILSSSVKALVGLTVTSEVLSP